MSTIVTRAGKGSALTHNEVDANFTNLNTDKIQSGNTVAALTITSATIAGGTINGTTVGATTPSTGSFTSLTDSGNLTFTGTGNRITGDFTNATVANRVMFQTSTVNGLTSLDAMPNGTSQISVFNLWNSSDPSNAARIQIGALGTEARLLTDKTGTGSFLPMTFYTGGSERMRVDTSGNVGIGTTPPAASLSVTKQTTALSGTGNSYGLYMYPTSSGLTNIDAITNGSGNTSLGFRTYNNGTYNEVRMDSSGNVGIGTDSPLTRLNVSGAGTTSTFWTNGDAGGAALVLQDTGGASNNGGQLLFGATQGLFAGIKGAIQNGTGPAGDLLFQTRSTSGNIVERARITSGGDFQFNSGYGSVATAYGCRAWVNFDGTSTPPSIRASGNVSSISRQATGQFTVNFSTALSSDYSIVGGGKVSNNNTTTNQICSFFFHTLTTTSAQFNSQDAGTLRSPLLGNIAVFR